MGRYSKSNRKYQASDYGHFKLKQTNLLAIKDASIEASKGALEIRRRGSTVPVCLTKVKGN